MLVSEILQCFLFREKEVGGCVEIGDEGVFGNALVGGGVEDPITGHA